jgi:hypothetical protein
MNKHSIIEKMKTHFQTHSHVNEIWFSGVRRFQRIHPWDEEELSFATRCWIDFEADSPAEANSAFHELIDLGLTQRHSTNISPNGTHVFAYALN